MSHIRRSWAERLACAAMLTATTACGDTIVVVDPVSILDMEGSWSSNRIAAGDSTIATIDFDATQSDTGVLTGCAVYRSNSSAEQAIGALSGSVTATRVTVEVEWEYNRSFLFNWSFESDAVAVDQTLSGVSELIEAGGAVFWHNEPTSLRRRAGGPGIFCGWRRPPAEQ